MPGPIPLRLNASELERLPYEDRLEACWSFVERAIALLDSARVTSAEASDQAELVTVRVSGAGTVDDIRFERAAIYAEPTELESAVVAAVGLARSRLTAEVTGVLANVQVNLDGWAEGLPRAATQAAEFFEGLRQCRERLADACFASSSVHDEVRAVTDMDGELRCLRLTPLAVRQTDRHTLGELVLACVRQAQDQADEAFIAALRDLSASGG